MIWTVHQNEIFAQWIVKIFVISWFFYYVSKVTYKVKYRKTTNWANKSPHSNIIF